MLKSTLTIVSFGLGLLITEGSAPAWAQAPRDTNIIFKDPRVFKAICYSGYRDGQGPGWAEPNETQVREDLTLIKRYTHEIRTYGSGKGGHGALVPKIADELGLTLHLGIWVDATYSDAANLAAVNDAIALVKEGHKSIKTVIVGNEYMLRVRHPNITPTPEIKPDKALSEAKLLGWIKLVKASVPNGVLVTTAEPWSEMIANSDDLIKELDFVTWHLHPWWEHQSIDNAVTYLGTTHKAVKDRVSKFGKRLVLGETGWPTAAQNGPAVGSAANQTKFFKDLANWGWNNNAEFWTFTAFDETWKDAEGAVGGHWGLWYSNRQPLPIITGINTLFPKYMWSENPGDITTGLSGAQVRIAPKLSVTGPMDALGRSVEKLSARQRAAGAVLLAR